MFTNIFSWFGTREVAAGPAYSTREVWLYRHIDPRTRRVSTRPVLVYRKACDGMFWGLPLAKTTKGGKAHYVPRLVNGRKVAALAQMRTLKSARLVQKIGIAGEKEFAALTHAIVRNLADAAPVKAVRPRTRVQPMRVRYERTLPSSLSPLAPIYVLQPRV